MGELSSTLTRAIRELRVIEAGVEKRYIIAVVNSKGKEMEDKGRDKGGIETPPIVAYGKEIGRYLEEIKKESVCMCESK